MFLRVRRSIRVSITIIILIGAGFAMVGLWNHYLTGPWTATARSRSTW